MVNHLIQGNRQGGLVTRHDIGSRVAHQNDIDLGHVQQRGDGLVVRRQHGDALALVAHALQGVGSNFADILCKIL